MNPRCCERGTATVETALVVPVVMLLFLGLVQFGLFYHAQHVVIGAAQEGARAAALHKADVSDGKRRAAELLRAGLGRFAQGADVSVSITQGGASARVAARIGAVVPLFPSLVIAARANSYRERFIPVEESK